MRNLPMARLVSPSTCLSLSPSPRTRRGITLLEVLFSIFVLAVGLLGLASMIPVGQHQVTNAKKFDNFSVIGRSAMNEVEARDLYHFDNWASANGSSILHISGGSDRFLFNGVLSGAPASSMPLPSGFTTVEPPTPFALDPLFISENVATSPSQSQWFAQGSPPWPDASSPWPMGIPRVTLGLDADPPFSGLAPPLRHPLRKRLAERIFVWQDDTLFDLTNDENARPQQMNLSEPRINRIAGDYSWMLTVSPSNAEDFLPASQRRWFTISTVVFYKRNLFRDAAANPEDQSERLCIAQFPTGGGLGGGDVYLTLPAPAASSDYFDVRKNQWILLIGRKPFLGGGFQQVAQWYRIVSVADETNEVEGRKGRNVTLQGPDWTVDLNNDNIPDPRYAAIYDGVIGVYEKNVVVDQH